MEKLLTILNAENLTHHAYGIESSNLKPADVAGKLDRELYSYIYDRFYDVFKVDDARAIKSLQTEQSEKRKLFIIGFTQINTEAQNALLKTLEEPSSRSYFCLIFHERNNLLVTLQSRLEVMAIESESDTELAHIDVANFVDAPLQEQFDLIKKVTDKKKVDDDKFQKRDLALFLNHLEEYYGKKPQSSSRDLLLRSIFQSRTWASKKGASTKMILENLAICVANEKPLTH